MDIVKLELHVEPNKRRVMITNQDEFSYRFSFYIGNKYVGDFVTKNESEMIYGFYQTSRFLIEEKEEWTKQIRN